MCLVGGKLQGFEAAYLSKKAGMKVLVVDKNPQALIRNYADKFHCFDVTKEPEKLFEISKRVDALLPVNENLGFCCKKSGYFTKPVKNITNGIFMCHKQVNNDTKSNSYSLKRQ